MGKCILLGFVFLAFGVLGACPPMVWSADPKPDATFKWEYRIVTKEQLLDLGNKDLVAGLNKLGDEGWELIAVEPLYIFKRPKPTPKQLEEVKRQVLLAEAAVEGWKDRVAWSERMVKKGYLTDRHLEEEKKQLQAAEIALEKAQKELKAFQPERKPEK
jgi:hypothetical protein